MKHLSIGIGLLAVTLVCSLLTLWSTVRFLDETERPLHNMTSCLHEGDFVSLLSMIEESRSIWDSHHGFFCSFFSHADLEEIEQGFAAMAAYAEQEELAELRDAHTRLLAMLQHLRDMDRPRYYNILTVFRKA